MIYDQSSFHNDLTIEGPGGTVHTADSGAGADALPITIGGNKAYGVDVTTGIGYRDNATSGVATGASPEGMYMVTSGTNVNNGCCFNYGNVETSGDDTGNGHMDAINFGTACVFGHCSGSGPWVEADLENGQYMGDGSNLGDQSISSNFVTAMLKNDGVSTFTLHAANAQSGSLTTEYAGLLPTEPIHRPERSWRPWSTGRVCIVCSLTAERSHGSKPALASFNGSLYVAFQANDPGHTLHVASSPDGNNFPPASQKTQYPDRQRTCNDGLPEPTVHRLPVRRSGPHVACDIFTGRG